MAKLDKVQIIDDDEINNFVCYKLMTKHNFANEVATFLSAHEGLDYLREIMADNQAQLPDLILLDINMPVMNGWAFLEEYKKLIGNASQHPVLLMLSSSVYEEDIEKARQHPEVKDYITKPLTQKVLDNIYEQFFQNIHQ